MTLILAIGNYLNNGKQYGNAQGLFIFFVKNIFFACFKYFKLPLFFLNFYDKFLNFNFL